MATFSSRFDQSALPPADTFFRENVKKFRRIGSFRAVGLCPFHPDHRPSLSINLNRGLFFCHACGAGGDIISFVSARDGVDAKGAAQILNIWRGDLSADQRRELKRAQQSRRRERIKQEREDWDKRQELIAAREWLHAFESLYKEASSRLSEIREGTPEFFPGEAEYCWLIMSEELEPIRQAEMRYRQLAGLVVQHEG